MISNRFRIEVTLRVAALTVIMALLLLCLLRTHWVVSPFILGLALLATIGELIWYCEKANREYTHFLLSIKSSDFTRFAENGRKGRSFTDLKRAFNIIMGEYQRVRIDKENRFTYLQAVMEHLNTAILSFDNSGEIILINEAAKKLFNTPYLKNIHFLSTIDPCLPQQILNIKPANKEVLKMILNGEVCQLTLRCTEFRLEGLDHKLVSVQNIKTEMENTELAAWEQLLRVLTHEIMNSVTPISSLSSSLRKKSEGLAQVENRDDETISDITHGLDIIDKRSKGLVNFVNNYRSLINLPTPVIKPVPLTGLLEQIKTLKSAELSSKGISLQINGSDKNLVINCDQELLLQVLLNLINNSVDALSGIDNPYIELNALQHSGQPLISVKDNGCGINPDDKEKIFVPFFTTKTNGSGIGLSLSKQIMMLHKGQIEVLSEEGKGTVFLLRF